MQHKTVTESEVAATTHTSSRFRDAMRRFRVSHMLQHFHVNNQKVRGDAQSDKLSLRRVKSGVIVSSPSEDPSVCNHTQIEGGSGKIDKIDTTTQSETVQRESVQIESSHPGPSENLKIETMTSDQFFSDSSVGEHKTNHSSAPAPMNEMDTEGIRIYKKMSTNGKLSLYLINRDLVLTNDSVSPLHAVITVDPEEIKNKKVFAQIILTFRYGRDDEEVMGLKLSNESLLCIEQIYPRLQDASVPITMTKCQEVLMRRMGNTAHVVTLKLNPPVPPSVRLLPAKQYNGAAIGISYDLRIYMADSIEDKVSRRSQVRMAIRVVQYVPDDIKEKAAPQLSLEKHFMLREWGIQLDAHLNRQWYDHGMPIVVSIRVHNRSSRIVRKIQIKVIQHVDVTMFSNGKFKNHIFVKEEDEGFPVTTGHSLEREYSINIVENNGSRHWIALEDRYGRLSTTLASTTLKSRVDERNFFAIYISYYVKIRLVISGVGSDLSMKIPFILMREGPETDSTEFEGLIPTGASLCENPGITSSSENPGNTSSNDNPSDTKKINSDPNNKEECQQSEQQLETQLHKINIEVDQQPEGAEQQLKLRNSDQTKKTSAVDDA